HILADNIEDRLGAISFYVDKIHYNLLVKILNDRFGIQMRGGCSCAGTYGHYLLHVSPDQSKHITEKINEGDLSEKPGWVRMSIHPTTTNEELEFIIESIKVTARNISLWEKDYRYCQQNNEFFHLSSNEEEKKIIKSWLNTHITQPL
ncbi:MAG: aminotransferase class V-fold PLP-dependent enzyme, partial [Ignavibacteriaceae bacterium]